MTSFRHRLDTEKTRAEVLSAGLEAREDRANRLSRQVAELQHELAAVNSVLNVENNRGPSRRILLMASPGVGCG
ncbi:hypothetical protein FHS21_005909 [Phyllobacterium trifolii]|uniref:Uncharacterized protein n=1 Tax=Phyllobacterium trifolii TaxID=300193 RepID=A0A839UEK9_9HYPH|nr:hypothetical protein [Phyllobacterium trifolii]